MPSSLCRSPKQYGPRPMPDDSMKTIQPAALTFDEEDRKCIACGYSLRGLGDERRCPECGLLNVPEGLRRQVQQLVDLKPWFFSSFLAPFEKRLPGWWWSLDRNDHLRRSFKFAGIHILVALLLVIPVWRTTYYFSLDSGPPHDDQHFTLISAGQKIDFKRQWTLQTSSAMASNSSTETSLKVCLSPCLTFAVNLMRVIFPSCPFGDHSE